MSNTTNDKLYDEAREMSEFWTGTLHQSIIDDLYEKKDLTGLRKAVADAQQDAYDLEDRTHDVVVRYDEVGDIY